MATTKKTTAPAAKASCVYQSLLSKSNETKNQELVIERVEEARIQIQRDILEAKKAVTSSKNALERAKSSLNFSSETILSAKYTLENAESDLNNLLELQEELF